MKLKTPITLAIAVLFTFSTLAAQTRDGWRSVRTNHLHVIGNADPEKLRQVAVWLEFFHGAFARLVSRNVIDSSVPTTVIVFRDDASFTPFKPVYNGQPANVSGYFIAGDDVNYIAMSLDPRHRDPYGTAFHEYVHLHVKDNVPSAPLWLNEGLAELYGSLQFSGSDALIGTPVAGHLYVLRQAELLPLKTLLSIGFDSPYYNEQEKAGIFYGQSWALVHYLMLGDRARQDQFKQFIQRVSRGDDAAKAIEAIYGTTLDVIEEELRAYVRRGNLTAQRITGVANPQAYGSYTATQRSSLTEAETNYYLGDLLLRQRRFGEAKNYLARSTQLAPDHAPAHYLLALINYLTNQDLGEAVVLAERAHKLAPSNNDYSSLLEHIKRKRNGPAATGEASESITNAIRSEPIRTAGSRMLGGETGAVAINDGQTVDSSGSLPTADEVLNKYLQAAGGAAALKAVTSRVVKGTLDVVGVSRGGTFETYSVAPNKALSILQAHPMGTIKIGYNGRVGWVQMGTTVRTLTGAELQSVRREANFYAILDPKSSYEKLTLRGKSKIGYREVYVLDMQPSSGVADRLFMDAETYLPVRMNTTVVRGGDSVPVEIYYDDWREVDGIKVPHVITNSLANRTLTLTVKEIRSNIPVDASIFEKPLRQD
jgi:tetratricopeptide (TPR) repeat protein